VARASDTKTELGSYKISLRGGRRGELHVSLSEREWRRQVIACTAGKAAISTTGRDSIREKGPGWETVKTDVSKPQGKGSGYGPTVISQDEFRLKTSQKNNKGPKNKPSKSLGDKEWKGGIGMGKGTDKERKETKPVLVRQRSRTQKGGAKSADHWVICENSRNTNPAPGNSKKERAHATSNESKDIKTLLGKAWEN